MPTYEYRCKKCEEHFEVVQSFSDKALTKHKGCGGELRKVLFAPGIAFKGSGFYKNDSRPSEGSSSSASSTSDTTSSDAGSSSTDTKKADTKKADAKPAKADKKAAAST